MPNQPLKLDKPYKNVDDSSLTSQLNNIQDGFLDDFGNFNGRLGYKLFVDLGTNAKVDGLHWSDTKENVVAVSNGKTFKITDKFGATTDLTGSNLIPGRRVVFTELFKASTLYLFMVNGGPLNFTDYSAATQVMSGSSTPPQTGSGAPPTKITHIANFNTYLIANNEGTNTFAFAFPNNPFNWDVGDSFDTEKSPDPVNGIFVVNNRLLISGISTIEPWYNSGKAGDPLIRNLNASYINTGVIAPYSIDVVDENRMLFINKDRRVVSVQGNTATVLSKPYDKEFQKLSAVSDANAFTMNIDGKSFYLITFPQAKRTLVYDLDIDAWYEWGTWNESKSNYDPFIANTYVYAKKFNKHLIGSNVDGKIYEISADFLDDDGTTLRPEIITGHVNWGNDNLVKESFNLRGRFKRGEGKPNDAFEEPFILVAHRDNGNTTWSNYKKISLGALGKTELLRTIYKRGGKYRTRQYKLISPDTRVIISGLWEDVEALDI